MKNIIILFGTILFFAYSAFATGISVQELHEKLEAGETFLLVDVREPWEREQSDPLGGLLIPLGLIKERYMDSYAKIPELEEQKNELIVFYDRTGKRSGEAALFLFSQGFRDPKTLTGGLLTWIEVYGDKRFTPSPKPKPPVSTPQVPKTAPEKLLFKTGAAALVEEATGWLSELIEDEEVIGTITVKWKAHQDLIGRSRTQILNLLLADVKSLITDKAALDSFVKGWNANNPPADDQQPNPVTPPDKPAQPPTVTTEGCTVLVTNLSFHMGDVDLRKAFGQIGEVLEASVLMNDNGTSKLFGYVTFASTAERNDAIKTFDRKEVDQQIIRVKAAKGRGTKQCRTSPKTGW